MAKKTAKKVAKSAKPKVKAAPKTKAKPQAKKPVKKTVAKKAAKKVVKPKSKPAAKIVKSAKATKPVKKPVSSKVNKVVKTAPKAKVVAKPKVQIKKPAPPKPTKAVIPASKPKVIAKVKEKIVQKLEPIIQRVETTIDNFLHKKSMNTINRPKPLAPGENRKRYSDKELHEFRELVVGKLEVARNELKYLQEQISRSSEMGDDSDARFKGLEDGTSTSEREYLSQMASRQIQYIGHLEKAMIRIENKTYGICRETGKLISKERLRAVPHATLSIEAKQGKG